MNLDEFRLRKEIVTGEEVADRIRIPDIEKLPRIILGIGPCRGATTFTLRLFGASGILPLYQHFKYILRNILHNRQWIWTIPNTDSTEILYNKETIGPYTQEECDFDPVYILEKVIENTLIRVGYGSDSEFLRSKVSEIINAKVDLLFIMRDPYSTWRSWRKEWVERKGLDIDKMFDRFVRSYNRIWLIWERARELSYDCHILVRDAYRDVEKTFNDLFLDLELPLPPVLFNWSNYINQNGMEIVFPEATPEIYDTHSFLVKAKTSNHVIYKGPPPINKQDRYNIAINHNNLPDIYWDFLDRHLELNRIRERKYLFKAN